MPTSPEKKYCKPTKSDRLKDYEKRWTHDLSSCVVKVIHSDKVAIRRMLAADLISSIMGLIGLSFAKAPPLAYSILAGIVILIVGLHILIWNCEKR